MTQILWAVSSLLFIIGLGAVVMRRQLLAMLLGLELMIAAVNVVLVYHAGLFADPGGLAAVLLILAVAAAEAVVGLTLVLRLHAAQDSGDSAALRELRG